MQGSSTKIKNRNQSDMHPSSSYTIPVELQIHTPGEARGGELEESAHVFASLSPSEKICYAVRQRGRRSVCSRNRGIVLVFPPPFVNRGGPTLDYE